MRYRLSHTASSTNHRRWSLRGFGGDEPKGQCEVGHLEGAFCLSGGNPIHGSGGYSCASVYLDRGRHRIADPCKIPTNAANSLPGRSVHHANVQLGPFGTYLIEPVEGQVQTGSESHLGLRAALRELGMTSSEPRQIIADALEKAGELFRSGIVAKPKPKREAQSSPVADQLSNVTEHVVRVDDLARILGVSTWSVDEAIRAGEMPAIHVGRRILIPTHARRGRIRASELERT